MTSVLRSRNTFPLNPPAPMASTLDASVDRIAQILDDHVTVGDESDYEDGNNEEPTIYVVRGHACTMTTS